ncbi:MAG: hypothetical protein V1871_06605 [Planctomycetota bacterium]
MRKTIGLSVFIILVWLIYPVTSNAETALRVKGLLWDSTIDGKIKADNGSLTGTQIDLKDMLGITKSSSVPEFEAKFNFLGTSRLIVSYMPASYEGTKTINQNISIAGKTFIVSERLKTNLDIAIGSVLYESLSFQETPAGAGAPDEPDLGLLLGVKYFYIDGQITSDNTAITAEKSLGAPIPVIGLRLQETLLEKAQIELTYTIMKIKTSGINVSWSDLYAELKLNLVKQLTFGVGYKLTKVNLKNGNDPEFLSRFNFGGLYALASLNF